MVAVPAELAATIPEVNPMPATEVLLLVHVPPNTELLSIPVVPSQASVLPVMTPDTADVVTLMVRVLYTTPQAVFTV
jgi:hypothetical protein